MPETVTDIAYDPSKPVPAVKLIYMYSLLNVAGYSAIALQVTFPPNAASPPHTHGGASVMGTIISGTAYNKMNASPTQKLTQGESWYEAPGCHHVTSANASETEELVLMAVFVVETKVVEEGGPGELVLVDEEWRGLVDLGVQA